MRRITLRGSRSVTPLTTGTPGLMMPAFSAAMAASVSPNCCVWSRLMLVMTDTRGVQTLVESSRPPSPTSNTTALVPRRAKWHKAMAVRISK